MPDAIHSTAPHSPRGPVSNGYVYLLDAGDGLLKIGRSDRSPYTRAKAWSMQLLACAAVSDCRAAERALHHAFASHRIGAYELFRVTLADALRALADLKYQPMRCAEGSAVITLQHSFEETAPLPSGHVGIYRADDGKRWEAYVMERDLVLLGVYPTKRAAIAARAQYWNDRERAETVIT